jgi:2-polyprenyl-6-methoxyphenol hydroxylase-like FAD-dependent oxidoreductase
MPSKTPKIAILGAGPAGLTLASLFSASSTPINFKIFDLRSRSSSELLNQPSGSLDLHQESGLLALKSCNLYENFEQMKAECGEECKIADKNGTLRYRDEGDGNRPEIARNALTKMLLDSIRVESIQWEQKVISVSPAPSQDGKWCLNFTSGSSNQKSMEVYDLVVGADGAWSQVRLSITDIKPHFSGINCITLTIPHLTSNQPHLASLIGTGSYSACGDRKAIMAQRGSLDSARIYLMLSSTHENWLTESGLATKAMNELKEELLTSPQLFQTWGNDLKDLIATGCDAEAATLAKSGEKIDMRPFYMLPVGHTWTHVPGLTLIGDAAHLMTPFAGEGVNAAMLDALELSRLIVGKEELDEAVKKYEKSMFPRAKEVMEMTWNNLNMIFSEDSPRPFVEWFESFGLGNQLAVEG